MGAQREITFEIMNDFTLENDTPPVEEARLVTPGTLDLRLADYFHAAKARIERETAQALLL